MLNHLSQCVLLELSELAGLVGLSESNLEKLIESLEKDKRVYLVNYKFVASAQSLENAQLLNFLNIVSNNVFLHFAKQQIQDLLSFQIVDFYRI